jgi:hypothetical protein
MNNSKTRWFVSFMLIALMLTVVTGVSAQSNVLATLSVDGDQFTIGDVIPLTLHVTHPSGWRVIVPTLEKTWGDFEVRSQATPTISSDGAGTETTAQQIEVVRMRPGEAQIPALTLSVVDDQGNLQNVEVAPVAVTIQSVLAAGDTQLRDIKPQAELITWQRSYVPIIVAVAVTSIALAVYAIRRRRSRPVIDKRTPRQRALATLKTIGTQDLQLPEDTKAACINIATCLKDYTASTATIPARDLTTSELAWQLRQHDLPADWITRVIEVLRLCDTAKFALSVPNLTTIRGLIDMVELLVEQYPPAPPPGEPKTKRTRLKGATA